VGEGSVLEEGAIVEGFFSGTGVSGTFKVLMEEEVDVCGVNILENTDFDFGSLALAVTIFFDEEKSQVFDLVRCDIAGVEYSNFSVPFSNTF